MIGKKIAFKFIVAIKDYWAASLSRTFTFTEVLKLKRWNNKLKVSRICGKLLVNEMIAVVAGLI